MFYCDPCAKRNDWPNGFFKSYGKCEMCGQVATCQDVHHSKLPPLKTDKNGNAMNVEIHSYDDIKNATNEDKPVLIADEFHMMKDQ